MVNGQSVTQHGGHNFPTVVEAQWAVFFDTMNDPWFYDQEAEWGLANAQHYRPQFSLPRLNAYLEVQRVDDHRIRQPLQHYYPGIEEPVVYLAVGELPDEQQLGTTGWWDPGCGQGVRKLIPGDDWEDWFPPDYPNVLQAIRVARTMEFESAVPPVRQAGEEVRDIPVREREQRPE
jgi:hypothetical protein